MQSLVRGWNVRSQRTRALHPAFTGGNNDASFRVLSCVANVDDEDFEREPTPFKMKRPRCCVADEGFPYDHGGEDSDSLAADDDYPYYDDSMMQSSMSFNSNTSIMECGESSLFGPELSFLNQTGTTCAEAVFREALAHAVAEIRGEVDDVALAADWASRRVLDDDGDGEILLRVKLFGERRWRCVSCLYEGGVLSYELVTNQAEGSAPTKECMRDRDDTDRQPEIHI
jgi:hypothetical protein